MTERGADLIKEAQESERSAVESMGAMIQLATEVNWDTEEMLDGDDDENGPSHPVSPVE